ncbi:MAG: glycine cleavage system protein H [Planctomycetota bacterium]
MSAAQDHDEGSFSFAMGDFEANFPTDRSFAKNHMWAKLHANAGSESLWRFGLTEYAVRLLQDVYFLEWESDPPAVVGMRQMIGAIESKKAESDLYAPVAGTLVAINDDVLSDPSVINADCYEQAWLIEMSLTAESASALLTPDAYREHLSEAWEVAQRTIKGQANVE